MPRDGAGGLRRTQTREARRPSRRIHPPKGEGFQSFRADQRPRAGLGMKYAGPSGRSFQPG